MINIFKRQKKEPKSLDEVLFRFKDLEKNFDRLSKELEILKSDGRFSVQKVGLLRYNPFKEVGGNQSFSIALLDANDSGIIITSLYSREGNRVYGKPVKKGKSAFLLTEEEKETISKAAILK